MIVMIKGRVTLKLREEWEQSNNRYREAREALPLERD
jgi:hypothetical protein